MNYLSYHHVYYIYQAFNYFSLLKTKPGITLNAQMFRANFIFQEVMADTKKKTQIIVTTVTQ